MAERLDQGGDLAVPGRRWERTSLGLPPSSREASNEHVCKKLELENARLRLSGTVVHTGVLACLFSVFFHPPSAGGSSACSHTCQSCLTGSRWDQRKPDIIREIFRRQKDTGRELWHLGPLEPPGALPRKHAPSIMVDMEVSLHLCMGGSRRAHRRVGTSSRYQRGPLAFTVRIKQRNGCNGDRRSFGKRALRIASLHAFDHEVQLSIFHTITPLLPDGSQCGRWSQSPWIKNH